MKRFIGIAMILALFSAPAFAANSQTVNIPGTVKVGSTQLPAGDYKVTWTGSGSNVQVTLTQNKKTAATVKANAVAQKNDHNGVITNTQGGVAVLQSIQLSSVSLVIDGATSSGQ